MKFVGGLVLLRPIPSIPFSRSVMKRWIFNGSFEIVSLIVDLDGNPLPFRIFLQIFVIDKISRGKNIKKRKRKEKQSRRFISLTSFPSRRG